MTDQTVEQLLTKLPQTQCQLCQHQGCRPYAEAIAQGQDDISKCQPGGLKTLHGLADVMGLDPAPWIETVQSQYKTPSRVVIDPDVCIGCTKCIQACPVDAIIGQAKAMHGVIDTECNGCDLCIPVCPMDCIYPVPKDTESDAAQNLLAIHYRERFETRTTRLLQEKTAKSQTHQQQKNTIAEKLKALQAQSKT